MSNKYEEFSKAKEKDTFDLVDRCNDINFDFRGKVKNGQCLMCANSCKDVEFNLTGECKNFTHRMSLNDIKEEIQIQQINVRRLCKNKKLKYGKMVDMLNGKIHLSFKYYKYLEERILEKDEFLEYIGKPNDEDEVSHDGEI